MSDIIYPQEVEAQFVFPLPEEMRDWLSRPVVHDYKITIGAHDRWPESVRKGRPMTLYFDLGEREFYKVQGKVVYKRLNRITVRGVVTQYKPVLPWPRNSWGAA